MVVPVCVSRKVVEKLLYEEHPMLLEQTSVPSAAVMQVTFGNCWISLQLGPEQVKDREKGCPRPQ
jgi:hypothetical protein